MAYTAPDPVRVIEHCLRIMLWPQQAWSMELLVSALDCEFKQFPDEIMDELLDSAESFGKSIPCEDAHSLIQNITRASKNGSLGRMSKWHRVGASSILSGYDRSQVEVASAVKAHARQNPVDPSMFTSKKLDISLGEPALKLMGATSWE